MIDKNKIIEIIKLSLNELKEKDSILLNVNNNSRSSKLHEICINHKLTNYLEKYFKIEDIKFMSDKYFDIEFNKNGNDPKKIDNKECRPDIILHNRKYNKDKINFLIIECKKSSASSDAKKKDKTRIIKFMKDVNLEYNYGLQVIYDNKFLKFILFSKNNGEVIEDPVGLIKI
jgi:hypothetical protein